MTANHSPIESMASRAVPSLLNKVVLIAFLAMNILAASAWADAPTGRDIMEKMEDLQRQGNDSAFNKINLSSCLFGIKDQKITCAERPRVKSLESVSVNSGPNKRDMKTVSIVLEPAAEKGVGMLSYTYDDSDKDNETWLYLSALGKIKRIASGNSDDDSEPASLFGSEFTTEDMDNGKLDEYEIRILEETEVSGRPVWKIENIPNEERARKTRYGRTVVYVDKERYVGLRSEMYDKNGKEVKRMLASRVERINGVWMARSSTMMNLITNRLSNFAILEVNTGIDVPDDFLSQRTLTDVAFREKHLENLRRQVLGKDG